MENQTKTLSIVALVCGILGIVLTFTPAAIVGLILAILGIIFSVVAKKKEGPNGMRTAGFVLSIIALVLWIIVVIFVGIVAGMAIGAMGTLASLGM